MKRWLFIFYAFVFSLYASRVPANPPNYTEQFQVTLENAQRGYSRAQYKLGDMYKFGIGVTQNNVAAIKWYRKAAKQGDSDAQFSLGTMYGSGMGVPKNPVKQYLWILLSMTGTKTALADETGLAGLMSKELLVEVEKLKEKCLGSNYQDCD